MRPKTVRESRPRARSEFVKKIYVGNLPWATTDDDLRELFATYGAVASSAVVNDRETGRSRGFGFVEMDGADADKAIGELDGRDYGGRALRVNGSGAPPRRSRRSANKRRTAAVKTQASSSGSWGIRRPSSWREAIRIS